jgi:hypothetical protein
MPFSDLREIHGVSRHLPRVPGMNFHGRPTQNSKASRVGPGLVRLGADAGIGHSKL